MKQQVFKENADIILQGRHEGGVSPKRHDHETRYNGGGRLAPRLDLNSYSRFFTFSENPARIHLRQRLRWDKSAGFLYLKRER